MRIANTDGEWGFKALGRINAQMGWELSSWYYLSLEEAKKWSPEVKWPVEVFENGSVYIPDESELK